METGADQYTVMVDSWISPGGTVAIQGGDGKFYVRSDLYKRDDSGAIIGPADWEERYTVPRSMWRKPGENRPPVATGLLCVDGVWIVCCTDAVYVTTDFDESDTDWILIQNGDVQAINQYHTMSVMPNDVGAIGAFDQQTPIRSPVTSNNYTGSSYYVSAVKQKSYFYIETVGTTRYVRCYFFDVMEGATIQIMVGTCTCVEFKLPAGAEMSDLFSQGTVGAAPAVTVKVYSASAMTAPDAGYGGFLCAMQNKAKSTLLLYYMSPVLRSLPGYNLDLPSALLPQIRILVVIKGVPYAATITLHGGDFTNAWGNANVVGLSDDGTRIYFGVSRYRINAGAYYQHEIRSISVDEIKNAPNYSALNTRFEQALPETTDYYTFNSQVAITAAMKAICHNVVSLQAIGGDTGGIEYMQPEGTDTYSVKIKPPGSPEGRIFSVSGIALPPSLSGIVEKFIPTIYSTDEDAHGQGVLALCGGELAIINATGAGGASPDALPNGFIKPVNALGSSICSNSTIDKIPTTQYATAGPRYRYLHAPYSF